LAMGQLQTVSYWKFYRELFILTSILTNTEYTTLYLRSKDREKEWQKLYQKKTYVKISQMSQLYKTIREQGGKKL
jgi:hypothetical protein